MKNLLIVDYSFISGKPAILVSNESIPANPAVLKTANHLTSPNAAAVPMAAMAVCATVFTALTDAAFTHLISFSLFIIHPISLFTIFCIASLSYPAALSRFLRSVPLPHTPAITSRAICSLDFLVPPAKILLTSACTVA